MVCMKLWLRFFDATVFKLEWKVPLYKACKFSVVPGYKLKIVRIERHCHFILTEQNIEQTIE